MFFSASNKILYIATPKTASTAVEDALQELIDDGTRHRIEWRNKKFTSQDVGSLSLGHATAREFRDLLGGDYDDLLTFAVIRDPIERLVSSYFFIRQTQIKSAFSMRVQSNKAIRVARQIINILAARILPMGIWIMLHPHKKQHTYVQDHDGRIIVKYLVNINRLNEDINRIFDMERPNLRVEIPIRNQSKHDSPDAYISIRLLKSFLLRRFRADYRLWKKVENGCYTNEITQKWENP